MCFVCMACHKKFFLLSVLKCCIHNIFLRFFFHFLLFFFFEVCPAHILFGASKTEINVTKIEYMQNIYI